MKRRNLLKLPAVLGLSLLSLPGRAGPATARGYDVAVIGAGVFGVWTAAYLHRAGRRVAVIDAVGPAHSGASSGGESRVTRCGYGDEELYSEWACRSMAEWRVLSQRAALPLFHDIGVLWIHADGDPLVEASAAVLAQQGVPFERLPTRELRSRYPVLKAAGDEAGFLEPGGGGLMARRAVQQLAAELGSAGVAFLRGRVRPIPTADNAGGVLPAVTTTTGTRIEAEQFVIACGPWLDRVCPDVMAGRLFVTRQDVFFFAAHRMQTGALPVWADLPFYGLPSLEGRGFKVANDTHGPAVDVDRLDRRARPEAEAEARALLARRFPALADSPLTEARVCQYENSSNGDFLIDRHPTLSNTWLAGCGSGHGFKHGPAVGAHTAGLVLGTERPIARFSLETKKRQQQRAVQ